MSVSQPEHIAISKSKGIHIDWKDGHHSEYTLDYLRAHCPCAACAEDQKQAASPFQMYKPVLKMDAVEPVGNYAIRIQWSDGHGTGIYSFEHFRKICPCPECKSSPDRITASGN
jgi:DUF971 family protein